MTEYVGTGAMAEILGISRQRLDVLVKVEGLPKEGRGKFDPEKVKPWFAEFKKIGRPDKASIDERKRLLTAQAVKTELEGERLRGTLVSADEAGNAINQLAVILVSQLKGVGPRLANHLSGITNPAEIQYEIKKETDAIRETIAGQVENLADAFNCGADSITTTAKNGS